MRARLGQGWRYWLLDGGPSEKEGVFPNEAAVRILGIQANDGQALPTAYAPIDRVRSTYMQLVNGRVPSIAPPDRGLLGARFRRDGSDTKAKVEFEVVIDVHSSRSLWREEAGAMQISKKVSTLDFTKVLFGSPNRIKGKTFERTFALVN